MVEIKRIKAGYAYNYGEIKSLPFEDEVDVFCDNGFIKPKKKKKKMPVHKVKGGYKWGSSGKIYPTKAQANRQAKAIYASGYKGKKKK